MTPAEAAALLTVAAAYDNRKPDRDQAQAWAMALEDYRFEDAREAVVRHYRATTDWLMPKHVIDGVKRIRFDRVSAFGPLPDPPRELDPDDTEAHHIWHRETLRKIADGEPVDKPPAIDSSGMPTELAQAMDAFGRNLPPSDAGRQRALAQARAALSGATEGETA